MWLAGLRNITSIASYIISSLLCSSSEVLRDRNPLPALVVDPQDEHSGHCGGRGQHHHCGVVHTLTEGITGELQKKMS